MTLNEVIKIADKYNIRHGHFPQTPDNKIFFYTYHKNNKGFSVLASVEGDEIVICESFELSKFNHKDYQRNDMGKAIFNCHDKHKADAFDFLHELIHSRAL